MKSVDLARLLSDHGYEFIRHGGSHDIWGKGDTTFPVPRHREINEYTVKRIKKLAGIKD